MVATTDGVPVEMKEPIGSIDNFDLLQLRSRLRIHKGPGST
jgi:hypothetical protein